MRIGASLLTVKATEGAKTTDAKRQRFNMEEYAGVQARSNDVWMAAGGNRMQEFSVQQAESGRPEAEKIYEAASTGGKNPIENIRQASKVPYGYLAENGVITYNGVVFVCDERTNSICLGDVSDSKKVLNIPLSGGGHLKVNRDSLGALTKAIDMFSPEDVNLIMRAIALDTKLQSMQQELDDMENSVGQSVNAKEQDAAEENNIE